MTVWLVGAALAAAPKGPVSASSEAVSDGGARHAAADAFDGLLSTGWAEGDLGDGVGAWLELKFPSPVDVESVSIFPGWLGGADREIREYGRPKVVTITIETAGEPVVQQERLLDPGERGPLRHDAKIHAPGAKSIKISLDEVVAGGLYSDTFIAEVAVNLVAGAPVPAVGDVATWAASDAGTKAAEAQRTTVAAMYDKIKAAEFGDDPSFDQLQSWASDGAPYLRDRVAKVPQGFKLAALTPDKSAIEALLKLKDSNAIPAIERASLRVTGSLAADLQRRAKFFDAYQELLGGGGRNIQPWGQEGFAKGALRSLGEPLDVAVDHYGKLYVADTGNNRVQRFSVDTGVVEQVWGAGDPGVTEKWFGGTRDAYASGATPGDKDGEFFDPVDLALVSGKDGDSILVLDASARITTIDPNGKIGHVQKLDGIEGSISAGVGGEGHVVVTGKKVVAIWGNQGFVYELADWTDAGKFTLEDGSPTSAVGLPGNKIGLVYGNKLVAYSIDGFRHGDILGGALGRGFQDWAVTLDDRGKLWAVLDTGVVAKFKKPGKVDYTVKVGEYSLDVPRIAVYDDHVFITDHDRILHEDALELKAKAEAGQTGSGLLETGGADE
jgi:hypothetical protein